MKFWVLILFICSGLFAHAADVEPSNTPKALIGSNGETVEMIEVNSSKKVVVRLSGIGGPWEGQTFLWEFSDRGDSKEAYFEDPKDFKRYNALVYRFGNWSLYTPDKPGKSRSLSFSKKDSADIKKDELLKSLNSKKP